MKKWKKWSVVIPVIMAALLLVLSPASALAQSDDEAASGPRPFGKGSLAIVAPRLAGVNQEISMTVFLRYNQEPFEGAGVWALTRDEAEALREEIKALRESEGFSEEGADYEAVADVHGRFIGRTDENGKLRHSFGEAGNYVLAAFHQGYFPGFTVIHIGELPRALAIEAPKRAPVGEEVIMTVTQRGTADLIEGAGVWAITRDNVEVLRGELTLLRENKDIAPEDKDFESLAGMYGIFLGNTDANGQLSHAFAEGGGYMLLTIKPGYFPGATGIFIGELPKALGIRVPRRAHVGEEVTMTIVQRGSEEPLPVEGAGVWVIGMENAETLREDLSTLSHDSSLSLEDKDFESLAGVYGYFIGRTDANGQLSHVFEAEGGYLLIAIKSGYFPGLAPIHIVPVFNKADELRQRGVPGNGIDRAPGLQRPVPENRPFRAPGGVPGNGPDAAPDHPIPDVDTTDA